MKPAVRKAAVQHLQQQHCFSQRRACILVSCNRKTARHVSLRNDDTTLREAMRSLAEHKPAWGYRMLHGVLRLDGWVLNHKKVYRLYREEQLGLKRKGKRRLKCEKRGVSRPVTAPRERWSMDFIHDRLSDGRSFRTLNLTDAFTRQCLAQEVDTSLTAKRVVRVLESVQQQHGTPQVIRVDNGSEFRSKALDLWAYENNVKLDFIEPGKPTQNGQIESFNGCFRAECLDQEWFTNLQEAREMIEEWRLSYNGQRPHSSLGYLPPDTWTQNYYTQQQKQQQNLTL